MAKPFGLYASENLPSGFRYPERLIQFSQTGIYPEVYPWWFVDAGSAAGRLSWENRKRSGQCMVPFAKLDDDGGDIACFDGMERSGNPRVVTLAWDEEPQRYADFEAWLAAAEEFAARMRGD